MNSVQPPTGYLPQMPQQSAPPPLFGTESAGPGQKPKRQSFFPTFLGSGSAPQPGQLGQKTLLGA
jgi:hypothetical protein